MREKFARWLLGLLAHLLVDQAYVLRPGDVIILQAPRRVSGHESTRLQDYWKSRVGEQIPLVVLDSTWTAYVARGVCAQTPRKEDQHAA